MLPKKQRLSTEEVQEVITKGRSVRGTTLSIKYTENKGYFHAAVVVSKKVAKKAVDRNRLRRTIYMILSNMKEGLNGRNMVFFILKAPNMNTEQVFLDEIILLLKKIK